MGTPDGYVIVDMDGCISDDRWRRQLLPNRDVSVVKSDAAYDWYHSQAYKDAPVDSVINEVLYDAHDGYSKQRALILVVTARPERMEQETRDWLLAHAFKPGVHFELLMRPNGSVLPSPTTKLHLLNSFFTAQHTNGLDGWSRVVSAYDDRRDVLDAYPVTEGARMLRVLPELLQPKAAPGVPEILEGMAATFRERNAVYGDNYKMVAPVMKMLWPQGIPGELVATDRWHLFELIVVKLTRFAVSGLEHTDSIHDTAVYAAMIESDLAKGSK